MNLIMNKTRNSFGAINVNKLMYIYMNERTLNRPKDLKKKLQFVDIDLNEKNLCDLENRQLQEKTSLRTTKTTKATETTRRMKTTGRMKTTRKMKTTGKIKTTRKMKTTETAETKTLKQLASQLLIESAAKR